MSRFRRALGTSSVFAAGVVALLATAGETTQAQQPAQPQVCTNVVPPFRQNGSQLQQAVAAGAGRYFTPRSASGISATMINALKITAARMADDAECRRITFSA